MLFKAPLACEQAVYSQYILASANHRDFLMELAFQVIYISLVKSDHYCELIDKILVPKVWRGIRDFVSIVSAFRIFNNVAIVYSL